MSRIAANYLVTPALAGGAAAGLAALAAKDALPQATKAFLVAPILHTFALGVFVGFAYTGIEHAIRVVAKQEGDGVKQFSLWTRNIVALGAASALAFGAAYGLMAAGVVQAVSLTTLAVYVAVAAAVAALARVILHATASSRNAPPEPPAQTTPPAANTYTPPPPPPTAEEDYNKGCDYEKSKDFKQAFSSFKSAAEKGHTEAQNRLGNCYYTGTGIIQDPRQAVHWFKSCRWRKC